MRGTARVQHTRRVRNKGRGVVCRAAWRDAIRTAQWRGGWATKTMKRGRQKTVENGRGRANGRRGARESARRKTDSAGGRSQSRRHLLVTASLVEANTVVSGPLYESDQVRKGSSLHPETSIDETVTEPNRTILFSFSTLEW